MIQVAPIVKTPMSYEEAVLYCSFCNHDGYSDWRLPTLEQLHRSNISTHSWYQESISKLTWYVTPVRVE
jgi:hypothetical protein